MSRAALDAAAAPCSGMVATTGAPAAVMAEGPASAAAAASGSGALPQLPAPRALRIGVQELVCKSPACADAINWSMKCKPALSEAPNCRIQRAAFEHAQLDSSGTVPVIVSALVGSRTALNSGA